MATDFIFEPDQTPAFVDYWMQEIGNEYRGKGYNGWAFLDDERRVLDLVVTDVEGEWLDPDTKERAEAGDAFEIVAQWAKEVEATNVIGIHTHINEPSGPCAPIGAISAGLADHLDQQGIRLRAIIILLDDKLDGAIWVQKGDGKQRMSDLLRKQNPQVEMLRMALPFLKATASPGDPNTTTLIESIESILKAFDEGEYPSPELLQRAIEAGSRAMMQPPSKPASVLDLPMFIPPENGRLN